MLKMFGRTPAGRPLVVLGLAAENMTRLLADEPIRVDLPEAALGHEVKLPTVTIVLIGGRTEAEIAEQIGDSPLARLLADNPATPGHPTVVDTRSGKPGHVL